MPRVALGIARNGAKAPATRAGSGLAVARTARSMSASIMASCETPVIATVPSVSCAILSSIVASVSGVLFTTTEMPESVFFLP
jgi:hypothetical protein